MLVYLSRHGEASHSGPDTPSSLTPKGQAEVTRMAEYLILKKNFMVNTIWHSPKTRAIQTAEIYRKVLGKPLAALEEKEELSPDGEINQILQDILRYKTGNLLLVSHLPFLPNLAALLLEDSMAGAAPPFPPAGIAAFDFDKTFKFLWTLSPSLIP